MKDYLVLTKNFIHFEEATGYAAFKGVPVPVLAVMLANIRKLSPHLNKLFAA